MGILGQFHDEAFLDAVRTVAKACRTHRRIFGIAGIRDVELLTEFVGFGLRFVSAGTDIGFMTEAASAPPGCAHPRGGRPMSEVAASRISRLATEWGPSARCEAAGADEISEVAASRVSRLATEGGPSAPLRSSRSG